MSHGGLFACLEINDLLRSLIDVFSHEMKARQRAHFPLGKSKMG